MEILKNLYHPGRLQAVLGIPGVLQEALAYEFRMDTEWVPHGQIAIFVR